MKVLVIEDDIGIRQILCEILNFSFFEPVALNDGREGLEYIQQNPQSNFLILLDLIMPGMNGWEFLRQVEELRKSSRMKIVVITGFQHPEKKLIDENFDQILEKPFSIEAILECVRKYANELNNVA